MQYRDAIEYLLSFADFERTSPPRRAAGEFALDRIQSLLTRLERPERGRLTVHVAGSKGKGSTCAMAEAVLRAAGFRTGLYTSPHLHEFTERIRIDGQPLSEERFAAEVAALGPVIEAELTESPGRLSTFEILTTMAFRTFHAERVDAQVVEVGLGGRLDTTNVVPEKAVAVITALSREHTQVLGGQIARIAAEKAGIVTPGTAAAILGPQRSHRAAEVVRRHCRELDVPLVDVAADYSWERAGADRYGQWFRLRRKRPRNGEPEEKLYLTPLLGLHQIENAATAVATIDTLRAQGIAISSAALHAGLATVRWPGRMETLVRAPWLLVDGAHNDEAMERVLESLREYFTFERLIVVFGTLRDKAVARMARRVQEAAAAVVLTAPQHPRSLEATALAAAFAGWSGEVAVEPDVAQAVEAARAQAGPADLICVLGSLFVAAEARAHVLAQAGGEPASASAERQP